MQHRSMFPFMFCRHSIYSRYRLLGNGEIQVPSSFCGRVIAKGRKHTVGHAVAHLVEAQSYKPGRSRVRFPMVSLEFFIDINLPAAL